LQVDHGVYVTPEPVSEEYFEEENVLDDSYGVPEAPLETIDPPDYQRNVRTPPRVNPFRASRRMGSESESIIHERARE